MADLAERYGAWLHVDGAFGLFARLSERTRHLVEGVERADSVIADGHKWLNVPYESGFAFVKDPSLQPGVFGSGAPYLPDLADPRPNWGYLGPEMSRRARSFPVWATLRAYGRERLPGHRGATSRSGAAACRRGWTRRPTSSGSPTCSSTSCASDTGPRGRRKVIWTMLNRRLGDAVIADGRVVFGTTIYDGKLAFRPALSNWRIRDEDVDLIVDVTLELGAGLA